MKIKKILTDHHTVAVVGASADTKKASNRVAGYLKDKGYRVIPVNPHEDEILGEKVYKSLSGIKAPVQIIDIFRPAAQVYTIVEEALNIKPEVIWMQEGIKNDRAADLARANGIDVIMDRCISKEHRRLLGT